MSDFKITVNKPVQVEPTVMEISLKIRDEFSFELKDANGNTIAEQDDGYVPSFVPGHSGDYFDLKIDVKTGKILNWQHNQDFIDNLQRWLKDNG